MKRKLQERQHIVVQSRRDKYSVLSPETMRAIERAAEAARKLAEKYGLSPTVRSA